MIRYVSNKVIINLKLRKCNNFFELLIQENIKCRKFNQFLNCSTHNKKYKSIPQNKKEGKRN